MAKMSNSNNFDGIIGQIILFHEVFLAIKETTCQSIIHRLYIPQRFIVLLNTILIPFYCGFVSKFFIP